MSPSKKERPVPEPPTSLRPTVLRECVVVLERIPALGRTQTGTGTSFYCSICDKTLKGKQNQRQHLLSHNSDHRPHGCRFCGKVFKRPAHAQCHESEVHQPERGPHSCSFCDQTFRLRDLILAHEKGSHWPTRFQCPTYDKTLSSKAALTTHARTHTGERPFPCSHCVASFRSAAQARIHWIAVHSSVKRFTCRFCSQSFAAISYRFTHEKLKHKKLGFRCSAAVGCGKLFSTPSKRTAHEATHSSHESRVKNFACSFCTKAFFSKDALGIHVRAHTGEKPYECGQCPKKFTSHGGLIKHRHSTQTADHERRLYACTSCTKVFSCSSSVRKHEREKHCTSIEGQPIPRTRFECALCVKKYRSSSGLQRHVRRLHDQANAKSFICQLCGFGFSDPSSLSRHVKIHTGEKPHKCRVCDKAFACAASRVTHEKRHTGVKPFWCQFCGNGKTFTTAAEKESHERRHKGDKRYSCSLCDKRFVTPSDRNEHERSRRAHGVSGSGSGRPSKGQRGPPSGRMN